MTTIACKMIALYGREGKVEAAVELETNQIRLRNMHTNGRHLPPQQVFNMLKRCENNGAASIHIEDEVVVIDLTASTRLIVHEGLTSERALELNRARVWEKIFLPNRHWKSDSLILRIEPEVPG